MAGDDNSRDSRGDAALRDLRRVLGRDPETGENPLERQLIANQERITTLLTNLADSQDGRINFRINSVIKEEFERLCKAKESTLSRELKRFMIESIRRQKLY